MGKDSGQPRDKLVTGEQLAEGRGQETEDKRQRTKDKYSPVGAAFQPRYHYSYDFNDFYGFYDFYDFNDLLFTVHH